MVKCGACGKYLSSSDSVKCTKCSGASHRACVSGTVGVAWSCSGCKAKVPREDNLASPASGIAATTVSAEQQKVPAAGMSISAHVLATDTQGAAQLVDGLAIEIRGFREELSAARAELREMRSELAGFQSSLKSCYDRIEGVEGRMAVLEQKFEEKVPPNVDALEDTIGALRQELNTRDQELLLNDVDIAGVPECPDDNLVHLVKLLALKVGAEIQDGDIVHVERVGPVYRNTREKVTTGAPMPSRPRNIVLRLARRITRDQLIGAARVRRSITSSDLELQGAPGRVYINERLTRTNRQLFGRAREAARRSHYKYVWTREGKIFARKEDGRSAERIRTEKDLAKIFGTSSV
ncbi:Zinc finger DNA binding protein [Operophtera brumata]|uniref:Zinc finger DNA binding protein n=1 Tax=Operophtera brumata TaxID=104452 RepID=A0A0L7LCM2_OPEBR|nr:Zinc finger DNA binding protein [Operophtera brumata]